MPAPSTHGTRIVRIITPEAKQAFAQTAPSTHLSYGGGPLLTSAQVVSIFWGAAWTQAPQSDLIPRLNGFFDFILKSALIDLLGEYSAPGKTIGHGRRIATVTIADSEPGGTSMSIDDGGIQQALQNFIAAGRIPHQNANTLYFVYLPPGVESRFFSIPPARCFVAITATPEDSRSEGIFTTRWFHSSIAPPAGKLRISSIP